MLLELWAVVGLCPHVELAAASRPPEASLRSQKSFCNTLAVAARADGFTGWAGRKSPEVHSGFGEGVGKVRGTALRPGQGQRCLRRSGCFRNYLGKIGVSLKNFSNSLEFGTGWTGAGH